MNLLLAAPREIDAGGRLLLSDRRHRHLREVLAVAAGDRVRVGEIDGRVGSAEVISIDEQSARLQVTLDGAPPAPLPVRLVLALPRPKMLRRILRCIAELGVKDLHLVNSYRVEKSFWQSPLLHEAALAPYLIEGLEQAMDTVLPRVHLHRRFRPFVEDELAALAAGSELLLADADAAHAYPDASTAPTVLIIGPEGGFIPFERELLQGVGARPASLGERVLRVETAVPVALAHHRNPADRRATALRP
jgi:RsmE family RNA methyltransferase